MKYHLKRIQGSCLLTYEEYTTVLIQVEGILNSRPLTPLSSDPNDYNALTPAHFLTGRPFTTLAEPSLLDVNTNRLSRWQQLQQIKEQYWVRWRTDYLNELQIRKKWNQEESVIKPGMLVLIKEDNLPPLSWKLARIKEVHPGKDNIVRVATLRTPNGELKRSISKLCPLPFYDIDNQLE